MFFHFIISILICKISSSNVTERDINLRFINLLRSEYDYPVEEHHVTTQDGYILTIHRIPHGKNIDVHRIRQPVLIVHGLTSSSSDFMILGPDKSLAYILADEGFDVWLINARGNSFSSKHIYLDEKNNRKEFYDFSWHEIGLYDLPPTIDYILQHTNFNKLYYIGHSQGGTSLLVMGSMKPEYNEKIIVAYLLAPGYIFDASDVITNFVVNNTYILEGFLNSLQIYNTPYIPTLRAAYKRSCEYSKLLCDTIFSLQAGYDNLEQFDEKDLIKATDFFPSQASLKQLYHFYQGGKADAFQQYDYGKVENTRRYNSEIPPKYNVESITVPIYLYQGLNDRFVTMRKSRELLHRLPNGRGLLVIADKQFNHGNFMFAKDVKALVYDSIINLMKNSIT